jgi:sugar phosphate isomerase/epimerase
MSQLPSDVPSLSRRRLIATGATTAVTAAGATLAASASSPVAADVAPPGNLPQDRIGVQMYTMREQVAALGFATVLRRLKRIGFREIEFAGFGSGGLTLRELRRVLADLDLRAVGNHGAMDDASLRAAEFLGLPYTGISVLTNVHGSHTDAWKQTADDLNAFGRKARRAGTRFYVHIHRPEYLRVTDAPDKHALELLLRYTDPSYVFWEMDIYWAHFFASYLGAGGMLMDPSEWVTRHQSRFPLFHVKDGRNLARAEADPVEVSLQWNPLGGAGQLPFQDGITDVGQGSIDFRRFLGGLHDVRAHHYIWERDTANQAPRGEFTSARASYLMMRHDHLAGGIAR